MVDPHLSHPYPCLEITAAQRPDAYVIRLDGELDLAGCPGLELALEEAEASQGGRIILDLERVTFIDSTGLTALLSAGRRSAANGNRLEITRGGGQVADMLRLTALDQTLPLIDPALCPEIQPGADERRSGAAHE